MSGVLAAAARTVRAFEEDLCLAFVNTRYWRGKAQPTETFGDMRAAASWFVTVGGWRERDVRELTRAGDAGMLARMLECRECIHELFLDIAQGRPLPAGAFDRFAAWSARVPQRCVPVRTADECAWPVASGHDPVATLLAPVQWSAADLLARHRMRRIRACGNPECRWLFIDRSKNGSRRWCDMGACGNREKARRHYEKMRSS